ncbi:MAG TPA: hypothetical protein GXX14_10205 [Clostridiaceae bacterium]|nr:hypothetical protein [Clostridiaceae bacterium]
MKTIRLGVIGTGLAWKKLHYPAIKEIITSGEIGEAVYFIRNNISCFPCKIADRNEVVYVDEPQKEEYINYIEGRERMQPYIQ